MNEDYTNTYLKKNIQTKIEERTNNKTIKENTIYTRIRANAFFKSMRIELQNATSTADVYMY